MRARVVAPLVAAILGIGGGVATALVVPGDDDARRPSTSSDPLHLGIPLVDQDCTGESLLVVGYGNSVAPLEHRRRQQRPEGRSATCAATSSCDTVLGPEGKPSAGVRRLPRPLRRPQPEPCEMRMTGDESGSFVTVLRSGQRAAGQVPLRAAGAARLRELFARHGPRPSEAAVWIRGLQSMLNDYDPERLPAHRDHRRVRRADGRPGRRVYQDDAPGRSTEPGVVDDATWGILTDRLCRNYDY